MDLREKDDAMGRARCIQQIGMVHHERFNDSRAGSDPGETVLRHAQAADLESRVQDLIDYIQQELS